MVPRVKPEDDERVGSVERETHRVMSKRDCTSPLIRQLRCRLLPEGEKA